MAACRDWLSCSDLSQLSVGSLLREGTVKRIYLGKWKALPLVVSRLKDSQFSDDFGHNLEMLTQFADSPYVVNMLGSCHKSTLLTEYHPLGDALNWPQVLEGASGDKKRPKQCLDMCISYVQVLRFLHNSPIGTRVMCDANSLEKLLSQFLITSDLRLVANDLDALPEVVGDRGVVCGHRELEGDFVAPEQLWPHPGVPFNESLMQGYDEKIDVWRIPDVCSWFLSKCPQTVSLMTQIEPIHKQCKERDPQKRPSASRVLSVYESIVA
jgi:glycoprotein-mannosyl O6-kinase